ncbi:hypothetical protein [Thiocapsa sp. UBA6158]|uniref:hypothetical protein n=1 Tax=Thiocapsa sp. UBA6158 TaxID=1947692 RepID=UPI0025E0717D|nr:hypothetical protein [Thiocapsa sp. UBA6158]
MPDKPQPSRGARLLARDLLADLRSCGIPVESDAWAHRAILLSHQLCGAVRFCLRQDPVAAACAVYLDRHNHALLDLVASAPETRSAALTRLLVLAHAGEAPA